MSENRNSPEELKYLRKGDILTHLYKSSKVENNDYALLIVT